MSASDNTREEELGASTNRREHRQDFIDEDPPPNRPDIRLHDGTIISYHSEMTDDEKFANADFIRDAKKYFKSREGYHSEMHKRNELFRVKSFHEDAVLHVENCCIREITGLVSNKELTSYGKNLEEAANFSLVNFSEMLKIENSVFARIISAVSFFKSLNAPLCIVFRFEINILLK